jgi:D-glycero-D-manno-heptose 1,7-bisphosphate phosphatase
MKRTAVFLDRDGTIIEDAGYVGDPQQVRLIRDAADTIRRFRQAGHLVVIVSNQSGVARGFFDEATMNEVHARVVSLLAARGADVDRAYYCPYLDGPEATVEAYRRDSELRKPKPGMLLLAAQELDINLSRSWMIGDSPADVEAGYGAGCRTILLRHNSAAPRAADTVPTHCVDSLTAAVELVELDMKQERAPIAAPKPSPSSPSQGEGRGEGETPGTADPPDAVVVVLERIHDQLERAHRKERQHDFSFLRLLGALLQMLAVVAALWGVVALMDDQSAPSAARLTLACFFQLAAVTAFAIDRFR